ncbi:MAG: ABC transporter substrate-binding protein, partial [Dehalococcoidia bacterium]
MKRIILVVSLVLALSLLLAACQEAAPATVTQTAVSTVTQPPVTVTQTPTPVTELPRNETIYVSGAAWGPPSTWNPFQPGSLANTTGTLGFVYETLFDFDPLAGVLTPWLAQSGAWKDATTYQIVLRPGLTWSDGQALTATDVAFTFQLGKTNAALWFAPIWSYLTNVTANDDTHLTFTFNNPLYQEWDYYLYRIPIVPKHLWQNRTADDVNTGVNAKPVGSGAYLYLSNTDDRNIWVRNDKWWGISVFGKPAPKYIVDIRTSSNSIALGMVLKGELDLSNNFLPGVAELVNKGYVNTYYAGPPYMLPANTAVLFLNTTKTPMNDAKFRRALAFAIDVPSIVRVAYAQLVKAASPTGLLPSLSKFDDQSVLASLGYSFNTAEAKQMLADAGYKDVNGDGFVETPTGATISLQVTCPSGWTDWMAAIDIIASSARAAGINIQSTYPDYGAWNTALMGGTFDMTLNNWAAMSN